jgi:hypothetical protein
LSICIPKSKKIPRKLIYQSGRDSGVVKRETFRNFGVNLTVFATIVCLVLTLGLLSHSNREGIAFAQSDSNATQFNAIRGQYLQSWEKLNFQSSFDTYITPGSAQGFGIYEAHTSNIFRPGETFELYIQPVGVTNEPMTDAKGNTFYFMNMTADIIVSDPQGNQATVKNLPFLHYELASYEPVTEVFFAVTLAQGNTFPEGDYKIKYIVTDEPSKESFEIVKDVKISNTG